MKNSNTWYRQWFDTPYYHTLYDHRDHSEAENFMKNLTGILHLDKNASILDLPCGRGRHAIFLNSLGYWVFGADLSGSSIEVAKKYENERLSFFRHNMLEPLDHQYDAIFNLFTSFGYFDDEDDNLKVLHNFKMSLKEGGALVIDFLNIHRVRQNLVPEETISKRNIDFNIKREIDNRFLKKTIKFSAEGKNYRFIEKVRCIGPEDFEAMTKTAGLKIEQIYGDYDLKPYENKSSERLILICK